MTETENEKILKCGVEIYIDDQYELDNPIEGIIQNLTERWNEHKWTKMPCGQELLSLEETVKNIRALKNVPCPCGDPLHYLLYITDKRKNKNPGGSE